MKKDINSNSIPKILKKLQMMLIDRCYMNLLKKIFDY